LGPCEKSNQLFEAAYASAMTAALVTGCSSGIGFATAIRLAGEGYEVVATMRNPKAGGARLLEAARAAQVEIDIRPLDVRDDESVRRAFLDINDLGVLVNNAGISWLSRLRRPVSTDGRISSRQTCSGPSVA
jgi:NAD(P)-dependent dehydrogenase (short-subunit alcohol dehydrogenase family)